MQAKPALFPSLLGTRWDGLPTSVRALHGSHRHVHARGRACVRGDMNWAARALRTLLRLPVPCADVALEVEIARDRKGEIWRRVFDGQRMVSHLRAARRWPQAFEECLGAARFVFEPIVAEDGFQWVTREVRLGALPLPLRWFHGVDACCSERDGRYRFDIVVRLPLVSLLIAYAGWLEVVDAR